MAIDDRLLIVGNGELLLLGTTGDGMVLSRQRLFEEKVPIYSHAALVGRRLYVRGESKLICVVL